MWAAVHNKNKKNSSSSSSSSRAAVIRRYRLMAAEVVPTAAPHTVMQIGLQSMQLDTLYAAYSGRMQQISIGKSSVSGYTVVSRDKRGNLYLKGGTRLCNIDSLSVCLSVAGG